MKSTLRNLVLGLGLASFVLVGTACGGAEAKEAEAIAKEACACQDKACAQAALGKFAKFAADNKKKKVSKKNAKKLKESMTKAAACMAEQGISKAEIVKELSKSVSSGNK